MKRSEDQLEQLLAITRGEALRESDGMRVTAMTWPTEGVTVTFELPDRSSWELLFKGVLEVHISVVDQCGLNIRRNDHPVLDQYTNSHESLHVGKPPRKTGEVIGGLLRAHAEAAGDWIPFDRYLEAPVEDIALVLGSKGALLATGPEFLIEAYSTVLEDVGCNPSRRHVAPPAVTEAVFAHFGESYIVAQSVSARRLDR